MILGTGNAVRTEDKSITQITHNKAYSGPGCLSGRKGRPGTTMSATPITVSQTVKYPYPCPGKMSQPSPQLKTLHAADVSPGAQPKAREIETQTRPQISASESPRNAIKFSTPLEMARSPPKGQDAEHVVKYHRE